ncbi:MAG: tetratricopeptide repeat protein [Deltaproteobacteria bacterium]|nr:tetratricopeptide repeat protein [Deltaproteobacteria bacterium]
MGLRPWGLALGWVPLAVACVPQLAHAAGDDAERLLGAAYEARDQGRPEDALALFAEAEGRTGPTAETLTGRALILGEDEGDWETAAALLEQAVALAPEASWVRLFLADAFAVNGARREAVDAYADLMDIARPIDAPLLVRATYALKDLGAMARAEAMAMRAVDLAPEDADALVALGHARRDRLRIRTARHAFEQAIRLEPGHAGALGGLSSALDAEGWILARDLGLSLTYGHHEAPLPLESLASEAALSGDADLAPADLVRKSATDAVRASLLWRAADSRSAGAEVDLRQSRHAYAGPLFGFEDIAAATAGAWFEQSLSNAGGIDEGSVRLSAYYVHVASPDLDSVRRDRAQVGLSGRLSPAASRVITHVGVAWATERYRTIDLGSRHWLVWGGLEFQDRTHRRGVVLWFDFDRVSYREGDLRLTRHAIRAEGWAMLTDTVTGRVGAVYVDFGNRDPLRQPESAGGQSIRIDPRVEWRVHPTLELSGGPVWASGVSAHAFDWVGGAAGLRLHPRYRVPYRVDSLRVKVQHRSELSFEYGCFRYYNAQRTLHTLTATVSP